MYDCLQVETHEGMYVCMNACKNVCLQARMYGCKHFHLSGDIKLPDSFVG